MSQKTSSLVLYGSLGGVLLGWLTGYYLPDAALAVGFIGELYFKLLKILLIPLVPAILITGLVGMGMVPKVNRTLGKTFLYFLGTGAVAVVVGLIMVMAVKPGLGGNLAGAFIPSEITAINDYSFTELISSVLPSDFFTATVVGQMAGLILLSVLLSAALLAIAEKGKVVLDFFQTLQEMVPFFINIVLWVTPVALFSLVGYSVARNHTEIWPMVGTLGIYTLTLLAALAVQVLLVLPACLKIFAGRAPVSYFQRTLPAILTAFGTGSAAATLPVTYNTVVEGNEVDNRAAAFTLPIGSVFNMSGTAIYLIVSSLFIAQLYGLSLPIAQLLILIGGCLLVSLAGASLPYVSVLLLALPLSFAGFPPQAFAGIGLVLAGEWLFGRLRAATNVWGDAVGAAVIGETFDFKTARHQRVAVAPRRSFFSRKPVSEKAEERRAAEPYPGGSRSNYGDRKKRESSGSYRSDSERSKTPRSSSSRTERTRSTEGGERKSRSSSERASSFKLPPVPYHVLENELSPKRIQRKSRDTDDRRGGRKESSYSDKRGGRYRKETPVETEPISGPTEGTPVLHEDALSVTREREKARVVSHLASMDEEKFTPSENQRTEEPPVRNEDVTNNDYGTSDDGFSFDEPRTSTNSKTKHSFDDELDDEESSAADENERVSHSIERPETPAEEKPAATTPNKPVKAEDSSVGAIEYGRRGKTRPVSGSPKTSSPESPVTDSNDETETAEIKPVYSLEKITFGRGRRKKGSE